MKIIKLLAASIMLCVSLVSFAQNRNVTARLVDGTTGEALGFATVSLTPEGESKPYKYVLSTDSGEVLLEKVRKGKFSFKVELLGYKTYTRTIEVGDNGAKLGVIEVAQDSKQLNAAKISDVGNPITIKKDTLEYNATLFKTSDNDMLIDLLKKLPGIEVGSDGSITANGKTINKITIDGKTFFLDDPQLATKNIPSKIVDKVKVVDKKSEQALFTGIDDGEEETIIDLGIKKGMMKGWFGNVMGGGGHDVPSPQNTMSDWRYQGAGFIGNFSDNQQISVILNGNNTNNRGFNDLAGAMMGGMRGGSGFGNNNGGINTTWMGGVNGAWDLLDKKMELAGNYLYNGSNKIVEESSLKNSFINENETLNYHNNGNSNTLTQGHRVGVRLDHKFSDNTSILFEPQFNIGYGNYGSENKFTTDRSFNDGKAGENVNKGSSLNDGLSNNWQASGRLLFRQRLGKAGRTLTINGRYSISNNNLNGNILNETYEYGADGSMDLSEYTNQYFNQNQKSVSLRGGITYTEPLYKDMLFLEANYTYSWNLQNSFKNTYDNKKDSGEDWTAEEIAQGLNLNRTYSNTINNNAQNHKAGVNLMFQKNKLSIQLGANVDPTITRNRTKNLGTNIDTTYTNIRWSPQMSLRYDLGENMNLRLNYWGRSNQPSTTQLMPVPDNSNPLNVTLGNPYLMPYFNHTVRGMFRYTNKQSFTSVNMGIGAGIVQDPIINTSWYESDGRQFSLPLNGPDSYSANFRLMVNSPLGKSKFSIFNMLFFNYNYSANYQKTGNTLNMSNYYNDGIFAYDKFQSEVRETDLWDQNFSINKSNRISINENFRLTYRNDFVELNLGLRERISLGWYSIASMAKTNTFNTTAEGTMNWTIPGGINLIAEYNYNRYDGYATKQRDEHVINAEITKLLFKDKVTIGLKGYDLAGMSRNISVTDTANYHSESMNNTLGRYIIFSITYRFGTFNQGSMRGPGPGRRGGPGPRH